MGLSELAAVVFPARLPAQPQAIGAVRLRRPVCRRDRRHCRWTVKRSDHPAHRQYASGARLDHLHRLRRVVPLHAAGTVRSRSCRHRVLSQRGILLRRADRGSDLVGADGYRAALRGHRQWLHELRLRNCGDDLTSGVRRHHRCQRTVGLSVHRLARAASGRRGVGAVPATRCSVRSARALIRCSARPAATGRSASGACRLHKRCGTGRVFARAERRAR